MWREYVYTGGPSGTDPGAENARDVLYSPSMIRASSEHARQSGAQKAGDAATVLSFGIFRRPPTERVCGRSY